MTNVSPWVLVVALCVVGSACLPDEPSRPDAAVPVLPSEEELLAARPFLFIRPDGYSDAGSYPLIIALHGYGDTNQDFAAGFSLRDLAARRSVFIAVPNGTPDTSGYRGWHPGPIHSPPWDVEYLAAIIHRTKALYAIDPTKIFVFGHSQGAHMAHRMGCDDSADVVALASNAGQAYTAPSKCAPGHAVSAVEIRGLEDMVIGYYGDTQHDPPDPTVPSAEQTISVWGRNNQCTGKLTVTSQLLDLSTISDGAETSVSAFVGCPPGLGAELWTMNGVGHWPFPQPDFMDQVLDYLTAHARTDAGM